jgi:hypothetical protein
MEIEVHALQVRFAPGTTLARSEVTKAVEVNVKMKGPVGKAVSPPVCVNDFNPPPFTICCPVARGTAQFTVTELPEQSPLS